MDQSDVRLLLALVVPIKEVTLQSTLLLQPRMSFARVCDYRASSSFHQREPFKNATGQPFIDGQRDSQAPACRPACRTNG